MPRPKDILFLMTDQHRPDYVGYATDARVATPHLDRLAEGMAFTNCVSAAPFCTPARMAILTGRYAHQVGMQSMSGDLHPGYPTYLQALQRAGYSYRRVGTRARRAD
ncbi:MAG: sulfatase-like hydrolase/transferase [Armatimonadota bacterium]